MFSAYVKALRDCPSFDCGNVLSRALPGIERATEQQIDELVAAANENTQVRHSFGFEGSNWSRYGTGLIPHLHRLGKRRFVRDKDGTVVLAGKVKKHEPIDDDVPF
jgi:hypothetical protein